MNTYRIQHTPLKVNTDRKWSLAEVCFLSMTIIILKVIGASAQTCLQLRRIAELTHFLLDNTYIITTFYHCRCDEDKYMSINTEV